MKFFTHLLFLARRRSRTAVHNDNLRAGKDVPTGLVQSGCLNGLLL